LTSSATWDAPAEPVPVALLAVLLASTGEQRLAVAVHEGLATVDEVAALRRAVACWRARVPRRTIEPLTWTAGQVAELLGVDERTVRRWAAKGRLPARREGRAWLIAPAGVRRLVAARDR
jgi:excisionase family DNA binding protein